MYTYPSIAELKHAARHEADMTTFNWDVLDEGAYQDEVLATFDYAEQELPWLERTYSRILNGDFPDTVTDDLKDELVIATAMISLAEELVSCYVLLELRDRYKAVADLTM